MAQDLFDCNFENWLSRKFYIHKFSSRKFASGRVSLVFRQPQIDGEESLFFIYVATTAGFWLQTRISGLLCGHGGGLVALYRAESGVKWNLL